MINQDMAAIFKHIPLRKVLLPCAGFLLLAGCFKSIEASGGHSTAGAAAVLMEPIVRPVVDDKGNPSDRGDKLIETKTTSAGSFNVYRDKKTGSHYVTDSKGRTHACSGGSTSCGLTIAGLIKAKPAPAPAAKGGNTGGDGGGGGD